MKKHILFDNIIYSLQSVGGISSTWALLQDAIQKCDDFDCKYIEFQNASNNIFRKALTIPEQHIVNPQNILPINIERFRKARIADNEVYNIFHSSYYRIPTKSDIKSVVTVHDSTYEKYMSHIRRIMHCKQKYSAINNADLIVCVSQNTYNDLVHYVPNIDRNKVVVIYNGISSDFYKTDNITKEERILYVGSRAKYKNFDLLIETLSDTAYNLDICGFPLSKSETSFLNKKIGPKRYSVYSNVDNTTLNKLYNSAYCLIYPSCYEGFGLPIIEAQRAGCPVIALKDSSISEIIGETPLLINNATKRELISAINKLRHPLTYNEVIECGLVNSQRFTHQLMTNSYIDLYNSIL